MSANYWVREKTENLGTLDASGANAVVLAPRFPIDVKAVTFVTTIAQTVADATITAAVRDVDDGNSVAKGTMVLPFTGSATDQVRNFKLPAYAGAAVANTVADQPSGSPHPASTVFSSEQGPLIRVKPGQEFSLTSDGGGDAGTYQVYVTYQEMGWSGDPISHATEGTFVRA